MQLIRSLSQIKSGLQPEESITVHDFHEPTLDKLQKKFPNISIAEEASTMIQGSSLVVCAVKPQTLTSEFFESLQPSKSDATLLSVAAGTLISTFREAGFTKVARSMPNTPAQIGQGMTVWTCTENILEEEQDRLNQILLSFGKSVYVKEERLVDMSTSISGSGPAYVFLMMEAMIDAGVHMGFSREVATTLTHQTLLGSTMYAMETQEHPAILRNSVTSPAGTTASALRELENGKFRSVVSDAIWACYRRSLEMGEKDSNVGPQRSK